MDETFRTLASPGEGTLTVRRSRFVGRASGADDVAAAEAFIEDVTASHPDATHVVPAYRIRTEPFREWSSDAGEPHGSAGEPILSLLRGEELENVVAVVVRYFGGTELGIGGLGRAYRETAARALAAAEVVERRPQARFRITSTYDDSGTIRSILEGSDASFEATYVAEVVFDITVPRVSADELRDRLLSATSGRARLEDS